MLAGWPTRPGHVDQEWRGVLLSVRNVVLFAVATLGLLAPQAHSQDADDLKLDVTGEITARCEINNLGSGQGVNFDLAIGGTRNFDFDVDCNLPMQIELSSKNGALVNQQMLALQSAGNGWTATLPYRATVSIDSIGFSETADSEDLVGGITYRTGAQIPFQTTGQLSVDLPDPGVPLPAGRYEDVISITVSADAGAGV